MFLQLKGRMATKKFMKRENSDSLAKSPQEVNSEWRELCLN